MSAKTDRRRLKVLVVENGRPESAGVSAAIREFGYSVSTAVGADAAWKRLEREQIPIVVATCSPVENSGEELCRRLRSTPLPFYSYVMFLTCQRDPARLDRVLDAGADDFLVQPFDRQELQARLQTACRVVGLETKLRQANDELQKTNAHLQQRSLIDPLMGIGNRMAFDEAVRQLHERAEREEGRYGLVMCDVDHFKSYNDTFGHLHGDLILKKVASAVKLGIRSTDRAFRYGGEEIALLLTDQDLEGSIRLAERVRRHVESVEFESEKTEMAFRLTVSCGVAAYPESSRPGRGWEHIVECADQALYAAKRAGRNRVGVTQVGLPTMQPEGVSVRPRSNGPDPVVVGPVVVGPRFGSS